MPETNKAIIQRLYDALNKRDWDALGELFAPDYVHHSSSGEDVTLEVFMQFMMELMLSFPDLQMRLEEMIANRDKVIVRWTQSAAHVSEFMGIMPTGKRVTWSCIDVFKLAGGKIMEDTPYWDLSVILRQLQAAE